LLGPAAPQQLLSLAQFQDNPRLHFGIVRGYRHTPFYDQLIAGWMKQGRVNEYVDEISLLHALRRGECAAALSYPLVYQHYLSEQELQQLRVTDWEPDYPPIPANMMFSKQSFSEAEAEKWRALMNAIYQDGTLKRIFERYMSPEEIRSHMLKPGQ
jgi:polar amino acid transport system substrate-binding protein